ncbi:unnamed protein product, partial [Oppiella nova]
MSTHVIIVLLVVINLRHLTESRVTLAENLPQEYSALNAGISGDMSSKLNSRTFHTRSSTQNTSTYAMEESVRQLRQYFGDPSHREAPTYQCQYMVSYFGLILFEFIKCILINEIPGNICLGCPQQYTDLISAHEDLTNGSVSNCSDGFINKDKLNLIHSLYSSGIYQWTDGNCDNCFGGKDEYQNLVVHNDTQYYFQLTEEHMLCLNGSFARNDSCVECKQSFQTINDYYDLMANNYSDGVCNDIIASMKDIRKHWSETLDCPTDFKSGLYLGLVVISVAVLPL